MANDWFQFKEFIVKQDLCGMKVSTDACILGALAYHDINTAAQSVLDIGTGTGLLSLMLGQHKQITSVTAVELNPNAVAQAQCNFDEAPWSSKLQVLHTDITHTHELHTCSYDIIICNPPFFSNHLPSQAAARRMAMHDMTLTKETLAFAITQYLKPNGKAYILYPSNEWPAWIEASSQAKIYKSKQWNIFPSMHKASNRVVGVFQKEACETTEDLNFMIRAANNQYTDAFKQLLAPFYLNL